MTERSKLLWFGRPPREDDHREAINRGLVLDIVDPCGQPDFRHARAAVFWATTPHFASAADALEAHIVRTIDEGLYLFIVVGSDVQRKDIARVLEKYITGVPDDRYRLRTAPVESHEVSNCSLIHGPGPAANCHLDIQVAAEVVLEEDHKLLLRRAFHDCRSIKLELISGGFSGALTFLVDATLADSNAGPNPMPYFAKLHKVGKLREEMLSFKEFAEHHVAWYLRPNFLSERCIYGVKNGILVGSFVQQSQSLWQAVLAGEGPRHIRSLFLETLGLLRQDRQAAQLPSSDSVVGPLEQFCNLLNVPNSRVEAANRLGGTIYPPSALWRKLLDLPPQRWRQSAIHGDMHGENVRVRKEDAIVIDFAHATIGPMSADLASLEVCLAFTVRSEEHAERAQWHRDIEALYRPEVINQAWSDAWTETSSEWLPSCIHEIRKLAKDSTYSADEYKRVLAVYLLRQATFPADETNKDEDEYRRVYAYWLANRMIAELCFTHEPQQEFA